MQLLTLLPKERIKSRLIDLVAYAADAGFYYLLPKAVVQVVDEQEVVSLFNFSRQHNIPLVFRTGGTSLSGQSITDGILVDLSRYWNRIQIEHDGLMVRVQPGIVGGQVNNQLAKYKRKIGPDPSSINAAMMGGILSNNASGMCCGVKHNSFHTTRFIRFILPNGKIFTTEKKEDYSRFRKECKELSDELCAIREEILSNEVLNNTIRKKYLTKNTVGYSLNALIEYEHPLDIFSHLLIGAEGTLAFIAEAVLETIPEEPFKATALLYFPDIYAACKAVLPLKEIGAAMVELMDRSSLRAVEDLEGMDPFAKTVPDGAAALLIEFQKSTLAEIEKQINAFLFVTGGLSMLNEPVFTTDKNEREFLWKVRKGLFPAVGAVRKSGTTVILEDVVFSLENLGDAILDLQQLFRKYNYLNAIIFGHAKDGNIHFVVTQSFDSPAEIERYNLFLHDVVQLVVNKYNGSLKAEHGTGRNMAPFVETEWGGDAYKIMKRIKAASDPSSLLNPGVIINDDKNIHIKNLKNLPTVEEEVDKCIECGYCEPVCPSRNITLTPRRRIVVRRELSKLKSNGDNKNHKQLLTEYQYDGLDTCAVDGLCANACPVDINTGDLVKRLRRENHTDFANKMGLIVAKKFRTTEKIIRIGLKTGFFFNRLMGKKTMTKATRLLKKIIPSTPLWTAQLLPPPSLKAIRNDNLTVAIKTDITTIVYFPSCISRALGSSPLDKKNIMETLLEVANKAGIRTEIMQNSIGSCCGQIFNSKGFSNAYKFTAVKIINQLWSSTNEGLYPVVMDVSSCTYTLHHIRPALTAVAQAKYDKLKIIDSIDFLHDMVIPDCIISKRKKSIVLHPVCSLKKMGTENKFKKIAEHFAETVTIPLQAGCCGMAGDRGFIFPELTASATFFESEEVKATEYDGYYSTTKTCEMAMSEAVAKNYESILYLVNECTTVR
ncbi:MAG: FAD-binding and (Fe-S)-binding domain-containing protein [Chitinophagaceae bacterium]